MALVRGRGEVTVAGQQLVDAELAISSAQLSVVDGRIRVHEETEDLVADAVAADRGADPLDHAGVVAAENHGELVLEPHLLEHPGRDRAVGRVD
jgi:hypothetical protein